MAARCAYHSFVPSAVAAQPAYTAETHNYCPDAASLSLNHLSSLAALASTTGNKALIIACSWLRGLAAR